MALTPNLQRLSEELAKIYNKAKTQDKQTETVYKFVSNNCEIFKCIPKNAVLEFVQTTLNYRQNGEGWVTEIKREANRTYKQLYPKDKQ